MAPVEKAKEAGQAIDRAERVLRSLKPPEKKRVIPVKIVQSIERAELAMKGAKNLAIEISRVLKIPRPERAADRRAQMQKLQKMADDFRTKLLELAKQKTGIDTIDKRHRQLIDNTVKGVSAVSSVLKRGDLVAANKNFTLIKERAEALERVLATQAALAKKGVDPRVIQLSDMALNHFISGKTARANLLLETCNHFARYKTALETTPTGNWSEMNLLKTAAILGGSPTELSDKDLKAISGKVKEFIAPMVTAQKQISNAVTLERERLMRAVRIGGIPRTLKSEADKLVRETAGLKPEKVAGMDPGKLGILSKRFLILKEAIARTKRRHGMTRDLMTRAYVGALKAIAEGHSATANVLLFAAGELFSPSVPRNLSRYRVLLGRHVDKLAKATTDKEREAEQARLKKLIGSSISARLLAAAKEMGGDAAAMLRKIASPLERSERLTLQQIGMAKGVLWSISRSLGKMKAGRLSASQKKEANSMLGRALGWLIKGRGELAGAQFALAFGYMDRSSTASQKEEFRKLSATLEKNPAAIGSVRLYVRLNNETLRYRRAMRRRSGDERQTIQSVLEEIAKLRARIAANGTIALPEDVQANVKSIRAKMATDKNFSKMITGAASRIKGKDEKLDAAVSRFVASTARRAAERKASQISQVFISIGDSLLSLKGSRYRRKGAVQILRYSLFSAQLGKYGDSNNFRTAAENYMKLRSTRDKDALLRLCSDAYNMQESGQQILSQTDLKKLNIYGMMARYLPKMSRRQRINAQAYFDMAFIAASRVRNPEEFRVVQDLAATYGALAAVNSKKLSPEMKAKRDKAMADLTAELGDYTWMGSKRLADIGVGGREGWQPRPGKITTPIAFALTTGTGPLSLSEKMIGSVDKEVLLASLNKKLGRKPTEAEIVSDVVPRGWKKLSDLAVSCGNYGALLEQIDFDLQYRKMTGALSERYRKHIARSYGREAARLRNASRRAMKRGNATLGEYFDTHSKRVSFQFVLDSAKQAKAMHAKGLELNQQAIKLGMEADGAGKKSMAEVNKRLTELRGMLTPRGQARLDAWLKQAGKSEKTIRAIYAYHLRYLAQRDSGRAMVLTEGAKDVMKALRSFDRSVRRVNSRTREDGRMELYAAVKTLTAIQAGKEVDFLGEEVKGGRLTAGLSRVLRNHAGRMLRIGAGRVKAQTRTMWVRSRIIRKAKREVRDANLLKTVQLIRQMISYVKEDEGRADLLRKLREITRIPLPKPGEIILVKKGAQNPFSRLSAKEADAMARKLSDFYKTLADTIPGVIGKEYSGNTTDLSRYNAMDRHKDYKRAVGFAWAERFRSANRTINRAVWAMDRDTQLVSNRITHMTLTRMHGQYGYPKSKDKKVEKILEPLRRMLLIKRMIGALPEKERAGFIKRFKNAKTDKQMKSLVSALSKKETFWNKNIGELIKKGGVMFYDAERCKELILELHDYRLKGNRTMAGVVNRDLEGAKRRWTQQERAYLNYVSASYQEINLRNERESLSRDHIAGKPKKENKNQKRWRLGQNKITKRGFIDPMSASIYRVSKLWTAVQNAALKDIDAQMESTDGEKLKSTPLFQKTSWIHTKEAQARRIATTIWMFTRPHLQAAPYAKDFRKMTKSYYAIERGRQLKTEVPLQYVWQAHLQYINQGIDLIASVLHKDNAILGTDMLLKNSIVKRYAKSASFLGQSMGHKTTPAMREELRISDELKKFIGFSTMEFSSYGHGSVRDNAKKKLNNWTQHLIMGTFRQMGAEPDNPYFWENKKGKYTRFEADEKSRAELDKTMIQLHKDIDRVRSVIAFRTAERGMFIRSWSKAETNRFLGAVDERMKFLARGLVAVHGGRHEDAARMLAFATSPGMEQPITRAIADKKRWDKILGWATVVSEFVASSIAIAVSPVFPPALAVPTAFGIKHIGESVETINYEGWSWGSGAQLGLAVVGTALPFLGEWAAASRFAALTGSTRSAGRAARLLQTGRLSKEAAEAAAARITAAGEAAGRLGMAETAVAAGYRGSKLRAFMRATPEVQKTMLQEAKTLAAEVAKGNISRGAAFGRGSRFIEYLTGGPAITRFHKAVHYMGHGMVAAGAVHFVAQLPAMTAAYKRGDVGAFDFFIGAWQSMIQPAVVAGYSMRAGAGAHTGVPKYIPRWKQWLGAAFLGLPIQSRAAHVMARNHARLNLVLERIPQTERRTFTNFIEKNGVALDAGAQIKVLQDFISARAKEPSLTFREYYRNQKSSGARQLRVGLLESAFQRVQSGMMRAETPEIQAYVKARRSGMAAERAAESVLRAEAAPAAVPKEVVMPPEVQGPRKLHKEVGDRVGEMSGRSVTGDSKKYIASIMEHLAVRFGGRDKIPAHMVPKEGATLYDTMKNSAAALKELMVAARERLGFEDNIYAGFLRKHRQSQAGQKLIQSLVKNGRIAKDSQPVGVIAFDGASTWLKNGLGYGGEKYAAHDRTYMGYEMGDLGLLIYMEAARRFQKANPEVYTRLQTAQGDEVIVLIRGDKLGKTAAAANKAIASYMGKFRNMLTKVATEMGIKTDSPLFRSLSDVNAHGGIVGVGKGSKGFSYAGKTHKSLDGALVAIEVEHSFKNLAARAKTSESRIIAERAVARMKTFISEMMGSKAKATLKPLRVDGIKQEPAVDAYATFRVAMEQGLRKNITRLAESNGKGRTHAENGLAGPSVMNQLGHPITDQLTAHFQDAMAAAFKKAGIADRVTIYTDGPMTFAFKFKGKVSMKVFNAALADAASSLPKLVVERGVKGITKATVESAEVRPQDIKVAKPAERQEIAEKAARDRMKEQILEPLFRYKAARRGAVLRVNAVISNAHVYHGKPDLRAAFTDKSGRLMVSEKVMTPLEKVGTKKWIRTPEDLISHFRDSAVPQREIEQFFSLLGFQRIMPSAREILTGTRPGARLRGPAPRPKEAARKAAVAGEPARAPVAEPKAKAPSEKKVVAPELAGRPKTPQRLDRQKAKYMEKPMTETQMADALLATWKTDQANLIYTRLKGESPEVQARVRDNVAARLPPEEAKGFKGLFSVFMKRASYRPVYEIDSRLIIDPFIKNIRGPPEEARYQQRVLGRGADEGLMAQGLEKQKFGFSSMVNIMLEGSIRMGEVGPLATRTPSGELSYQASMFAGAHGPFYIILEKGTMNPRLGGPIRSDKHLAYVVPSKHYRRQIAASMFSAVRKGLITRKQAIEILSKVVTYREFVAAPRGIFSKPGAFSKPRIKVAELLLKQGKKALVEIAPPPPSRGPAAVVSKAPKARPAETEIVKRFQDSYKDHESYKYSDTGERAMIQEGFLRKSKEDEPFRAALFDNIRKGMHADDAIEAAAKKIHPSDPEKAKSLADQWKTSLLEIIEPTINRDFPRLDAEGKIKVLQKEFDNVAFRSGYKEMVKSTLPKDGKKLLSAYERLMKLPQDERDARFSILNDLTFKMVVNEQLPEILRIRNTGRKNKILSRLKSAWTDLQKSRQQLLETNEARTRRTPEQLREQELPLIKEAARKRGLKPDEVAALYKGTTESRLAILDKLGIKVEYHSKRKAELTREFENAGSESERGSVRRKMAKLDQITDTLFELIVRGDLQGRLQKLKGFERATIKGVARLTGGEGGVFKVELTNGKNIFVKMENGSSAKLGSELAIPGGLLSSKTHTGHSYETGLKFRNGKAIKQEFHLIEDIHNFKGTKGVELILPDGTRKKVDITDVIMADRVMRLPKGPKDPGPGASKEAREHYQAELKEYQTRMKEFENNPAVRKFYERFGTKKGREEIFRAWNAYHELCRRIGMGDRRPPNTAIVFVKVPGVKDPVLTFQPIDTGAIGWNITSTPAGYNEYRVFYSEFGVKGSAQFITYVSRSAGSPIVQRLMGVTTTVVVGGVAAPSSLPMNTLYREMFSATAIKGFTIPSHNAATVKKLQSIVMNHRPALIGMNLDKAFGGFGAWMGQERLVPRPDGQVRLFRREAVNILAELNMPDAAFDFINQSNNGVAFALHHLTALRPVIPPQSGIRTPPPGR